MLDGQRLGSDIVARLKAAKIIPKGDEIAAEIWGIIGEAIIAEIVTNAEIEVSTTVTGTAETDGLALRDITLDSVPDEVGTDADVNGTGENSGSLT